MGHTHPILRWRESDVCLVQNINRSVKHLYFSHNCAAILNSTTIKLKTTKMCLPPHPKTDY